MKDGIEQARALAENAYRCSDITTERALAKAVLILLDHIESNHLPNKVELDERIGA